MLAKAAGVKKEEMAWTGLDDFLAGKKSVTKQEVLEYLDTQGVNLGETVLGSGSVDIEDGFVFREDAPTLDVLNQRISGDEMLGDGI